MSDAIQGPAAPPAPPASAPAADVGQPLPAGGALRLDLGDVLLRTTRLDADQLGEARRRQAETGERLADIVVEEGLLNADEVQAAIAE